VAERSHAPDAVPNTVSVLLQKATPAPHVEREELLLALSQVLQGSCRVLVVTGITGIGKTILAEQLIHQQRDSDQPQLHLNFDLPGNQLPFVEVAAASLRQLGEAVAEDEKQMPQQLLKRWLTYLISHSCWVLMDSVEQILKGNEQTGWSIFIDPLWKDFFHQLLGEKQCQSRLVLTSQDLPADIDQHQWRYQPQLYISPLTGFSESEQAQLFKQQGFDPDDDDQSWLYLRRIGRAYEGHPLALQVVLGEILSWFEGDVVAYWQTYGHEIEVVEAAKSAEDETQTSSDALRLDRYSRQLRKAVRQRIEKTFQRLRRDFADAFLLLCTIAVYRDALPESFLLSPMQRRGWSPERCRVALDALVDRYLLEVNQQDRLRQHPLIRSVALSYFDSLEGADERA